MIGRRGALLGALLAPAIIRTPGLLMPVKAAPPPPIVPAPQHTYTLTTADNGRIIPHTATNGPMIVRIPPGLPKWMRVTFHTRTNQPIEFVPDTSVCLLSPGSLAVREQYAIAILDKPSDTDAWALMGRLG
jgi:hypothetical protein